MNACYTCNRLHVNDEAYATMNLCGRPPHINTTIVTSLREVASFQGLFQYYNWRVSKIRTNVCSHHFDHLFHYLFLP